MDVFHGKLRSTIQVFPDSHKNNITNDNWKDLKSFRSPGQPYVISPISRRKIWCEEGRPVVGGTTTYKTPFRLLKIELDYIAYGLEGLNYRMYSSTLEDYSSKPYVSNSLKTRLLELSLELRDVDPYLTRISRSVTNKLKRAEQLIRIVYVNGVSYFEQQFGNSSHASKSNFHPNV